jgi:hypothetical protein
VILTSCDRAPAGARRNYVYLMNGTTVTGVGYLAEADLNWQVQNPR